MPFLWINLRLVCNRSAFIAKSLKCLELLESIRDLLYQKLFCNQSEPHVDYIVYEELMFAAIMFFMPFILKGRYPYIL